MGRLERTKEKYNSAPEVNSAIIQRNPHLAKVTPEVLQVILLDELTGRVAEYLDDRTSNGRVRNYDCDVTDKGNTILLDYPAQSISIFNDDGPDAVHIKFNEDVPIKPTILKKGETLNINFETHVIELLYLKCDTGETASLRIIAKD